MKRIVIFIFILGQLFSEKELSINFGDEILVNNYNYMSITSSRDSIESVSLPEVEGIVWSKRVSREQFTRIINGKVTSGYTYRVDFLSKKSGDFVIPSFKVLLKSGEVDTKAQKITVGEQAKSDYFFMKIRINNKPIKEGDYFNAIKGQEMNLSIDLYIKPNYRVNGLELDFNKNILNYGYSSIGSQNKFSKEIIEKGKVNKDGFVYRHYIFTYQLVAIEKGKSIVDFLLSTSKISNNSFSFFSTTSRPKVGSFKLFSVKVVDKLNLKDGEYYTGLIGNWKVKSYLEPEIVGLGNAFKYVITFEGDGDLKGFVSPKLDLPGFEIVTKNTEFELNKVRVIYTLVPIKISSQLPELIFSYYSTKGSKYKSITLKDNIEILPIKDIKVPKEIIEDNLEKNLSFDKKSFSTFNVKKSVERWHFYLLYSILLIVGLYYFIMYLYYFFRYYNKTKCYYKFQIIIRLLLYNNERFILFFSNEGKRFLEKIIELEKKELSFNEFYSYLSSLWHYPYADELNKKKILKYFSKKIFFKKLKSFFKN